MGVVGTAAGGGKVTVTGLAPEVVKSGTTVTVKSGSRVVQQVTGTLSAVPKCSFSMVHPFGYDERFYLLSYAVRSMPGFTLSGGSFEGLDYFYWTNGNWDTNKNITVTATENHEIVLNADGWVDHGALTSNIPGFRNGLKGPQRLTMKNGNYIKMTYDSTNNKVGLFVNVTILG